MRRFQARSFHAARRSDRNRGLPSALLDVVKLAQDLTIPVSSGSAFHPRQNMISLVIAPRHGRLFRRPPELQALLTSAFVAPVDLDSFSLIEETLRVECL